MTSKSPLPDADWDEHYRLPIIRHGGLRTADLSSTALAIHEVRLDAGRTLDFYAKLEDAQTLFVSLHGAVPLASPRYPHFRRVESMRNRVDALLCLADPTLQMLDDDEFRLGWYAGGEQWDPIDEMVEIIETARKQVGASRIMFLGGSGGGLASLRIAPRFPGSMAFVQDPQTSVRHYYAGHRDRLIRSTWPSWDLASAFDENPERFDMRHLYSATQPDVFVYYRQSSSDEWHVKNHALPFERAVEGTTAHQAGRFRFVYEEGEKPGHGKITPAEFDRHFDLAMDFWGTASAE